MQGGNTVTPNERKDYIANLMLKRGVNKNSIIAMLCNAYTESARTFDPKIKQFGGAVGSGIWQWSNPGEWQIIRQQAATHSEKEGIEFQVNYLLTHPGQWMPKNSGMSWNDFLHNTKNMNWDALTYWFCWCWERPASPSQAEARKQNYNLIMPINWDGNAPDGGHGNDQPKQNEDKKGFKFNDCRSLFNKNKPNKEDNKPTDQPSTGGVSQGFNPAPCLDYYNKYHGKLKYSLSSLRSQVFYGTYSDCSSFVSYMLELGYGLQTRELPTTEYLHGFLTRLGYKCVEQGPSPAHMKVEAKTGDVIILGRKGTSSGAGGHTGICLQAPKWFDSSYSKDGLGEYANGQAFLNWHYSTNYWYHYQK